MKQRPDDRVDGERAPDSTTTSVDWEAIYWQVMPRIYNYFRYRTGDNAAAEDLTSITFVKAWRARTRFQGQSAAFEAWLFTIARHCAIDYRRQHPRAEAPLAEWEPVPGPSVEQEAQRRQEFAHLQQLLAALPTTDQEIVALKYGGGLTNRAIATMVGLSESNVGTRLHRVLQKLRYAWETTYDPE